MKNIKDVWVDPYMSSLHPLTKFLIVAQYGLVDTCFAI